MCNLTQFVVIVPVPGSTSALISKYFMQDVLLKFGLCLLVVIDDGTPFKAAFTAACTTLKLPFTPSSSLFFIQYIPEGSIRPRWFLVKIELDLTYSLDLQPETTGHYLVAFLARHPRDKQLTDDFARWWPEWHEYTIGADNIPDFGQRVLFHPLRKPNLSKFRLWTDTVPLSDPNCYLQGPFDFESRNDVLNPCNYVARDQWLLLASSCSVSGIVPPLLSPNPADSNAPSPINTSNKKTISSTSLPIAPPEVVHKSKRQSVRRSARLKP